MRLFSPLSPSFASAPARSLPFQLRTFHSALLGVPSCWIRSWIFDRRLGSFLPPPNLLSRSTLTFSLLTSLTLLTAFHSPACGQSSVLLFVWLPAPHQWCFLFPRPVPPSVASAFLFSSQGLAPYFRFSMALGRFDTHGIPSCWLYYPNAGFDRRFAP